MLFFAWMFEGVQGFSGNEGLPGSKGSKGDPGPSGPRGMKGRFWMWNVFNQNVLVAALQLEVFW